MRKETIPEKARRTAEIPPFYAAIDRNDTFSFNGVKLPPQEAETQRAHLLGEFVQFWREFVPPSRVPGCWIRQSFEQPARADAILVVVERRLHAGQPAFAFRQHRRTGGSRIRMPARCAPRTSLCNVLPTSAALGWTSLQAMPLMRCMRCPCIQSGLPRLFI